MDWRRWAAQFARMDGQGRACATLTSRRRGKVATMRHDQPRKLAKGPLLLAAVVLATVSLAAQVIPLWQVLAIFAGTAGLAGIVLALAIGEAMQR